MNALGYFSEYRMYKFSLLILFASCISLFPHKGTGYIPIFDFDGKKIAEFPKDSKWIGFDEYKYFPLTQLQKFPKIESLEIRSPKFQDVSEIANLKNLTFLNLDGTSVTDTEFLKTLPLLRTLILNQTKITKFNSLTSSTQISKLHLYNTPIQSLDFLKYFPKLRHLDIRKTIISDLSPISNCKNLMDLQIGDTNVTELKSLHFLKDLLYLEIDGLNLKIEEIESLKKSNRYVKIVKRKYF